MPSKATAAAAAARAPKVTQERRQILAKKISRHHARRY